MEATRIAPLAVPLLWSVRLQDDHHTGGLLRLQLSPIVPNSMVHFTRYSPLIAGTKVVPRDLF